MNSPLNYNERAWAIDVISEINLSSSLVNLPIKRAGGENTLSLEKGSMFPDVLLFGDENGASVLQGWELKMPDTKITDNAFITNAETKARRLKLNSFLLWNATEAVLYILNHDTYSPEKYWSIPSIKTRADVAAQREQWKALLNTILSELNHFFSIGTLLPTSPDIVINDQIYSDFLSHFEGVQSVAVQAHCLKDADFESELDIWFEENRHEVKPLNKYEAIAQTNIIHWINQFIFAHYLKLFNQHASLIDDIHSGSSVQEAMDVFDTITSQCDFMNVFKPPMGHESVDATLWCALLELNSILINLNFRTINQESFHNIIDTALAYSRKKLAGQFSTPTMLADYLVAITVKDRTKHVIDTCCGTGTIAKSVYHLKRAKGLSVKDALKTTWASDKFSSPLQLSSIALSDPLGMGEVVQTFKQDVLSLNTHEQMTFTDPYSGNTITRVLPKMHAVTSNLPFVRFEDVEKLNPQIKAIRESIEEYAQGINKKADLYAYITLKLKDVIEDKGRLGLIISNAWLGVEWGDAFKKALLTHFNILRVIISGKGRWFSNAQVVTTVLVLESKTNAIVSDKEIPFIRTLKPIRTWNKNTVDQMVSNTLAAKSKEELIHVQTYTLAAINNLESIGIGWNAFFVNLSWLDQIKEYLTPISLYFEVKRGSRRGWDTLFYPTTDHTIEPEFIQPVLKTAKGLAGQLNVTTNQEAFCCSKTLQELKDLNKVGALSWIKKFQCTVNGTGKPLPEALATSKLLWYEMNSDTLADIVVSLNPDKKLCFHQLNQRSFVNQRLIRLTRLPDNKNIDLCHALLNSSIGMFLLEACGFGRGLGALDLSATKISNQLHILNPALLSTVKKSDILNAFAPLLLRAAKDLPEELLQNDRITFDEAIIAAYGLPPIRTKIYDSLLDLYHLRQTARH